MKALAVHDKYSFRQCPIGNYESRPLQNLMKVREAGENCRSHENQFIEPSSGTTAHISLRHQQPCSDTQGNTEDPPSEESEHQPSEGVCSADFANRRHGTVPQEQSFFFQLPPHRDILHAEVSAVLFPKAIKV